MNLTRNRARSIGWALILTICFAVTMGLTIRVNALKSEVRLAERQIVSLRREKMFFETEFETRANQQQLRALNAVDFGYSAPTAGQYLSGERQLSAFGKPAAPGAPAPIRVASAAADEASNVFPTMVNPLTGKAMAAELPDRSPREPVDAVNLKDRLSKAESRAPVRE
jgi:hypothetical protein